MSTKCRPEPALGENVVIHRAASSRLSFGTVTKPRIDPAILGYPGCNRRTEVTDGMVIERDVPVVLRDGVTIYIDIYKPEAAQEPTPVLIGWSPYGKHKGVNLDMLPGHDVDPDHISRHYYIEVIDPMYWCAHGYTVIFPDPRGAWSSHGEASIFSSAEAEDYYDLIEWAGVQGWSNGKVGLAGQSYFAISQWRVAELNPPHLACINPWGAVSDVMRNLCLHGGIPNDVMLRGMNMLTGYSDHGRGEDWLASTLAHPFDDAFWADKRPELERITVPAFVVGDWTDQLLHTPGTMDGFNRISSEQKWLEINGGKKWEYYLKPESVDRLRAFYDKFLKGLNTEVDNWPPVRIEVRDKYKVGRWYDEQAWPLERAVEHALYLHADGRASPFVAAEPASRAYEATTERLVFSYPIDEPIEITGFLKLRLWVEADGADDIDLFVAVRKIDKDGQIVNFPFYTIHNNGEVSLGCLRVSHRTLDPVRSTDLRPFLSHDRELPLAPGEIVKVDIPLMPTSTAFEAGDTMQIIIQGRDIPELDPNMPGAAGHTMLRNKGHHVIHMGGNYDSHLLFPVVPPRTV